MMVQSAIAQQPRWVVNNSIVNPYNNQVVNNPIATTPNHTQNAVWDDNGNILFYEEDGEIYNSSGVVISNPIGFSPPLRLFHSEFIFVPVPGECDMLYAIGAGDGHVPHDGNEDAHTGMGPILMYYKLNKQTQDLEWIYNPHEQAMSSYSFLHLNVGRVVERPPIDNYHIGVTADQGNGTRYLFVSTEFRLNVFRIDVNGITPYTMNVNNANQDYLPSEGNLDLRAELEVYENEDEIRVALPILRNVILSQNSTPEHKGGIEIHFFSKTSGNNIAPMYTHYEWLNEIYEDRIIIKGLEFSPDGEKLYFSSVLHKKGDSFGVPIILLNTNNLRYLEYVPSSSGVMVYKDMGGYVGVNSENNDFGFGMIEVDTVGSLWIAGHNRLGKLVDANDPNSFFNSTQISLVTYKSLHDVNGGIDVRMMNYLLPDQIDGEGYETYFHETDQYPETLYVCSFPHQLFSDYTTDWGFEPCSSHVEPPQYYYYDLGSSQSVSIDECGTVHADYVDAQGCERNELIYVDLYPVVKHGADFTYTTTVTSQGMSISAVPKAAGVHVWTLFKKIQNGQWVLLMTKYVENPTFQWLSANGEYKLRHEISPPPPSPFPCPYAGIAEKEISD